MLLLLLILLVLRQQVATWYCWGNTHFCDDCHTRQMGGDFLTKLPPSELPGWPCEGGENCPLGLRSHPPAGRERALGCALCRDRGF